MYKSSREPVRRPGGRSARVRRRILEATVELIARDGIGGLRYDEIAELAGVNKTTVYRNWPDRMILITDALTSFGTDVAPLPDSGDIDADLVDFLEALATVTSSPEGRALLSAVAAARAKPELQAIVDEVFDRRMTNLHDRLHSAVERGELPPFDVSLLGAMLSSPVQQISSRDSRTFTRDDAKQVSAIVLAGVRAIASVEASVR